MENENKDINELLEEEQKDSVDKNNDVEELKSEEDLQDNTVEETETNEDSQENSVEETEVKEKNYDDYKVITSIKYDYRTMKYYNMYNTVGKRKLPIWYFVLGVISFAFAVYNVVSTYLAYKKTPEEVSMTSAYIFGAIFVLFAIYLIKQALTFENMVDNAIANHFANHKVHEQNIAINDEKITLIPVDNPRDDFSYDWSQVVAIHEIDQFFYLYIGKSPLMIDKDPLKMVKGTYEELEEIIDSKIKLKPYKRVTRKIVKKPITYVHKEQLELIEEESKEE